MLEILLHFNNLLIVFPFHHANAAKQKNSVMQILLRAAFQLFTVLLYFFFSPSIKTAVYFFGITAIRAKKRPVPFTTKSTTL